MAKKQNTGQPRRGFLLKAGMALLALINKGIGPTDTFAESNAVDLSTKSLEKSNDGLKPIAPTPADFVSLGEQISYLSNLPSGTCVHDVGNASRILLDILSDIDLPTTREHSLDKNKAATEFFRLAVEIGMDIDDARMVRNAAQSTR